MTPKYLKIEKFPKFDILKAMFEHLLIVRKIRTSTELKKGPAIFPYAFMKSKNFLQRDTIPGETKGCFLELWEFFRKNFRVFKKSPGAPIRFTFCDFLEL